MASEHYFSSSPESELRKRRIHARIAGEVYELETAGGVFSPDRIDAGTQVLLSHVPAAPPGGNLLDLGCGWGPISLTLATMSPRATVWAVDVNERALELVRGNAALLGLDNIRAVTPDEVPADATFMTIWSNPPIRVGKNELHDMLQRWIPRLEIASDAWLVVQRNLGADSLHRWIQQTFPDSYSVVRAATNKGYRVLRVRRRSLATGAITLP